MATDPQFAAVLNLGAALLGSAETSLSAPTTTSVIVTAGGSGTKVEEVVVHAAHLTTATAAGMVYLFLFDGTTYSIYDTIPITVVTPSASVPPFRISRTYTNLWFKTGWFLRASQSVAGNANLLKCEAFGGDY